MNLQTGKVRISKKLLCVILSMIIAFGTFVTVLVSSSWWQDWLGIQSMLSAYAAEFVDTDGAVAIDEEAMKADDHTINLENKDGSNTVYLFSEPISYTDENGDLKTKDISVVKADRELKSAGYDYTNGQNDYRINFSKDYNIGIQAEFEGASYSIIPQSVIKVDGAEAVAEYLDENFEVFQYKNIYGNGTNLRFYPQLNGIKDEIVLNQNIHKNTFTFELKTENCTARLNEDGTISLVNTNGTTIQTFTAPFACDSEYVEGDNNSHHYVDCEYTLQDKNETSYLMTITVPSEWLDSENTKYPVVIDPTTSNLSQSKDAGIYKKYKNQNFGSEQTCCFGYSSDYDKGRVYTQFTLPSAIKKGAVINSAEQWERETTGRTTSTKVIGYLVKESWTEGGVIWAEKPAYKSAFASNKRTINSKSEDNSSPYWYKFNIKSIVNEWINGSSPNYGITFRSDEEDNLNYNWRAFASRTHATSSYRPYTVINYTNDTTAPTVPITYTPSTWTKGDVTFNIDDSKYSDGNGSGKSASPYAFSTSSDESTYSWKTTTSFKASKNGTYYIGVRDILHNIRKYKYVITNIDKLKPNTPTVTVNPPGWTKNNVSITVQADDAAAATGDYGKSGVKYYSCTKTAGQYDWKTVSTLNSSYTFSNLGKGTYYIYAKDQAGNISAVKPITPLIDTTEPTYVRIDKVDSPIKGDYVDVKIIEAKDTESGLHASAYSFDGGATWQSSATKRCTSAQTLNIRIRDVADNIKNAGPVTVNPVANCPKINSVEAVYYPEENKTRITVNASDVETSADKLIYSYNGSVKTKEAELNGKISSVDICVTDEQNHKTTLHKEYTFAEKYSYNDLIGIYSESGESLRYKIDNGDWADYAAPFAVQNGSSLQIKSGEAITAYSSITVTSENTIGEYVESATDLTVTNNDISFDISRNYGSVSNEWTFSTECKAELTFNGKMIDVSMPEGEKYHFIKIAANEYKDEVNDITLTISDGKYVFTSNELTYKYNVDGGRLAAICGKFDNSIVFTYDNNGFTITSSAGNAVPRVYTVIENNGKLTEIKTPVNETLIKTPVNETLKYEYTNDGLVKVYFDKESLQYTRNDDIILSEYGYTNNKLTASNGSTIVYENGKFVSVITPVGETVNNEPAPTEPETPAEPEPQTETTYTYYDENEEKIKTETVTTVKDNITYKTVNEYNTSSQLVKVTQTEKVTNGAGGTTETYKKVVSYTYFDNSEAVHTETVSETTNGKTTSAVTTYKADGKVDSESSTADGKTTLTSYEYDDAWGNVTSTTVNENGVPVSGTTYTYDELNRCTEEMSTSGGKTQTTLYAYNPLGEVIYEKCGDDVTRTMYDKYNRVIQEIEPQDYKAADDGIANGIDSYAKTDVGHRYVYNPNGTLAKEINRLNVATNYTYHTNSSVVATETFDIYRYEYNTKGALVDIFVSDVNYAHYVYENDLNTAIHYGNGQKVYYEYEGGNLKKQSYTAKGETTPVTQFTYTYDSKNVLTSKTDCINNRRTDYGTNTVSVYDISGNSEALLYSYASTDKNAVNNTPATAEKSYAGNTLNVTLGENINQYKLNNSDVFNVNSHYENDRLDTYNIKNAQNNPIVSKSYTYDNDNNVTGLTVNNTQISYVYEDDKITEYHQGDNVVYYHYDPNGQLEREDIHYSNYSKTITYEYDERGNLTEKNEYPYTREENPSNPIEESSLEFDYKKELWLDEIVETPTETILYDENGNPVNLEDCVLEWTNGRQLKSVSKNGEELLSYTYDDDGIRTSKTYQGTTTYYATENGVITSQYQLDSSDNKVNEVIFIYDNGNLISAYYDNSMYYYITNVMGDVISIIDESGNTVVDYCYDAWGNVVDKTVNTELTTDFAAVNPILYRSYYFDEDLGVYYLQSRYYKSDWCRFINSDLPTYAQEQKNDYSGLNLFAYCCNEPVSHYDPTGHAKNKNGGSLKKEITIAAFYYVETIEKNGKTKEKSTRDEKSTAKAASKKMKDYLKDYYKKVTVKEISFTKKNFAKKWKQTNADFIVYAAHGSTDGDGGLSVDIINKLQYKSNTKFMLMISCYAATQKNLYSKPSNAADAFSTKINGCVFAGSGGVRPGYNRAVTYFNLQVVKGDFYIYKKTKYMNYLLKYGKEKTNVVDIFNYLSERNLLSL